MRKPGQKILIQEDKANQVNPTFSDIPSVESITADEVSFVQMDPQNFKELLQKIKLGEVVPAIYQEQFNAITMYGNIKKTF